MLEWLPLIGLGLVAIVLVGLFVIAGQRWVRESIARGDEREIRRRLVTESAEALLAETDARIADLHERFASANEFAGSAAGLHSDPSGETNRELARRIAYRAKIVEFADDR